MSELKLYVGNKNYSSWSLRPWLALTAAGIEFEDEVIPFDFPSGNAAIKAISPNGRVPILIHKGFKVWESLAIIEYAAELYPQKRVWPEQISERALARAYSMEMATGFPAIRNACPMNFRRAPKAIPMTDDMRSDIARIEAIWKEGLDREGGPFLFGGFSAADAMFAPVVNRFEVYELTNDRDCLDYMAAVKAHPAWIAWAEAAAKETAIVPEDEV
jgi:glutathione S-transferase